MKISIVGWSCEGLRCPDVEIDLRQSDGVPFHLSLLQMPNGTGKTTTLELLKATLSGEVAGWDEAKVRGLRRKNAVNPNGQFKVRLLLDGKPLTFEAELDFENGHATCLTTRPGSGGLERKWNPPREIRRFLDQSFLNLFVFNGELASDLFKEGEAKAENAIDALCQLYLIEDISGFVEDAWGRKVSGKAGPKSDGALATLRKKREELRARKAVLQRMRAQAVEKRAAAKKASDELEAKINEKTSGLKKDQSDHAAAKIAEANANAAVEAATSSLLLSLRHPLSLHPAIGTKLASWKNHLDELKLPETTSAQFFADLKKQVECICGTTMTDGMRDQIENQAKRVLSSDENGALNAIKRDIERYQPGEDEDSLHDVMKQRLATLSSARRDQLEAQQSVRTLWRKILEAGGEQVQEWGRQQKEHDKKFVEYDDTIKSIDDPGLNIRPGEQIFSLTRIERDITDATTKISDATATVKLRAKTDVVARIVERAEKIARKTIKTELVDACNKRLADILSDDPIELDGIDGHLKLAGQERGSEAQTLSVGYTFLMTLLERGDNRFPLLVDSPVGKMDGTVRRSVGRLVPTLCSQFVTFVINTERADFVSSLESRSSSTLYLTFFRQTPGTQRLLEGLPAKGVHRTDNGILVNDKAYFDSFDMEKEE